MSVDQILTVTEVTRHLKGVIEHDELLQDVWIRGELSNFKLHSRGHMYFTIKDENSRMQAVMFAGNNRFLRFKPDNGMNVLVRGEVNVYEPFGQYQFYAKEMQPDGIGSLYLAYEELKERLEKEGLFREEVKKPIPSISMNIAIVTSPTGAAIRDMVTTIKRRFPVARITLLPVLVQGSEAPASIARAIEQANLANVFDVIIVGRGGGSIEELWAFNEEIVARAIYRSTIPVISAVGHETDYTIADFVADLRAATPTGAAELAVPDMVELIQRIDGLVHRMRRAVVERATSEKHRLERLQKSYAFRYPEQLIRQKEQEFDQVFERLKGHLVTRLADEKARLMQIDKDLARCHPSSRTKDAQIEVERLTLALKRNMQQQLQFKQQQFNQCIAGLNLLSPLRVMERGYSLAYNQENKLIKSTQQATVGTRIDLQVIDGMIACEVKSIKPKNDE
ncbi:exodeoxyribonuclease VII large subunit [Halalkalibacterium ligniniphilum]|uniref:exodeoxyribonuclease VII large subunit n=1 Tax=Halalkalibacterium ligniniphilum TaxID=1134413 RepID=UPI000349C96E|nr:exodeoxyribonuclease VII large subunit [Halalkalibacterium ligniniphilum]